MKLKCNNLDFVCSGSWIHNPNDTPSHRNTINDLYNVCVADGAPEFTVPDKALSFTQLIKALRKRSLIDVDPEPLNSDQSGNNSSANVLLSPAERLSASHRAEVKKILIH